jgi:hypothetical protein
MSYQQERALAVAIGMTDDVASSRHEVAGAIPPQGIQPNSLVSDLPRKRRKTGPIVAMPVNSIVGPSGIFRSDEFSTFRIG